MVDILIPPLYNALNVAKVIQLINLGIRFLIDHFWGIAESTLVSSLLVIIAEVVNKMLLSPNLEGNPESVKLIYKFIYDLFNITSLCITVIWNALDKVAIWTAFISGALIVFRILFNNYQSNRDDD